MGLIVGKVTGFASDHNARLAVDFRAAGGGMWDIYPNQISRQKPVCCRPGFH